MYWMWEFPADLRQHSLAGTGVAFLLATAEQQDQRLTWRYRHQPLYLPPATVRQSSVPALPLDADVNPAGTSADLLLLGDLRKLPGTFLSITANPSWCRADSWLDRAPVDEVVPMFLAIST